MDPRKNRKQPKATRGKNRGLPNQFVNPQFNPQFNPDLGFSQFASQAGSSMPIQSSYNEFHLEPSLPPRYEFQSAFDSEEDVPETQEEDEEDEEDEEVEVIPAPTKGKTKSRMWTHEEETALAKAYINVSEDPVKGDHQRNNSFWKKVLAAFNTHIGVDSGRTHHQVTSKWKDLNTKVTSFAGIYNKKKSNMSSGMNDEDVLKAAQTEYSKKHNAKAGFPHLGVWEVLRKFPKWSSVATFEEMESSSSKRARTSESNARSFEAEFMPINLNEEQGDEDEPEQPARPTEPPRRNRKKPVESTSSIEREQLMKMVADLTSYNKEEIEDKKRARAEKLRLKQLQIEARIARDQQASNLILQQQRQMADQQKQSDLEFILTPHDQYTGSLLETVLARKREVAARWGWEF